MPDERKTSPGHSKAIWLVRIVLAGAGTVAAKELSGWKIGRPELLAVFLAILFVLFMGHRLLAFRGTWRIASLLVVTVIVAVLAQFLLIPYNALQRQRAAVQRITNQGGRVNIWWARQSPDEDVMGWSQTRDRWMVPTFLFRWWQRYLGLGEIDELDIPASLVVSDVLKDLQPRSAYRMRILLDGTNQMDPNFRAFFPRLPQMGPPFFVFQSIHDADPFQGTPEEYLTDEDLQVLNSVKESRVWIELNFPERMERLRKLERPFSFVMDLGDMPVSKSLARMVQESVNLETLRIRGGSAGSWKLLFDALNQRANPIELDFGMDVSSLTEAEWQAFSTLKNVHALSRLSSNIRIVLNGTAYRPLAGADLDLLAMPDLKRLEVRRIDRLPTLYRAPNLETMAALDLGSLQIEDLRPMIASSIRKVVVNVYYKPANQEGATEAQPEEIPEAWLDHFQPCYSMGKFYDNRESTSPRSLIAELVGQQVGVTRRFLYAPE